MKIPSFDTLNDARRGSGGIEWDSVSEKRYIKRNRYFCVWEDDVVTLSTDFDRDSDRTHFGQSTNITVGTPAELPLDRYALVAPCGTVVNQAALTVEHTPVLLIDWDHNVAVRVAFNYRARQRDRGYQETVRWPMPGALPLPRHPIVAHVHDRAKAKEVRPYVAELLKMARATLRLMDGDPYVTSTPRNLAQYSEIIEARGPLHETFVALTEPHTGSAVANTARFLVNHLSDKQVDLLCRRGITCTYLNVVPKGARE